MQIPRLVWIATWHDNMLASVTSKYYAIFMMLFIYACIGAFLTSCFLIVIGGEYFWFGVFGAFISFTTFTGYMTIYKVIKVLINHYCRKTEQLIEEIRDSR